MGMSTHVKLLRSKNDPTYQEYLKVLMACKEAEINPPKIVNDYFGGDGIDNDPETPLEIEFKATPWGDESREGFQIELSDLPEGVKTIRFYNAY